MVALTAVRVCSRCAREYRELDNVGAWRCRMHPGHVTGAVVVNGQRSVYTCCNGGEAAVGCVACDHAVYEEDDVLARYKTRTPHVLRFDVDEAHHVFGTRRCDACPGFAFDDALDAYLVRRHAEIR